MNSPYELDINIKLIKEYTSKRQTLLGSRGSSCSSGSSNSIKCHKIKKQRKEKFLNINNKKRLKVSN